MQAGGNGLRVRGTPLCTRITINNNIGNSATSMVGGGEQAGWGVCAMRVSAKRLHAPKGCELLSLAFSHTHFTPLL